MAAAAAVVEVAAVIGTKAVMLGAAVAVLACRLPVVRRVYCWAGAAAAAAAAGAAVRFA
jgi:hypothetical protein